MWERDIQTCYRGEGVTVLKGGEDGELRGIWMGERGGGWGALMHDILIDAEVLLRTNIKWLQKSEELTQISEIHLALCANSKEIRPTGINSDNAQ